MSTLLGPWQANALLAASIASIDRGTAHVRLGVRQMRSAGGGCVAKKTIRPLRTVMRLVNQAAGCRTAVG
jgi:hypothetical protein